MFFDGKLIRTAYLALSPSFSYFLFPFASSHLCRYCFNCFGSLPVDNKTKLTRTQQSLYLTHTPLALSLLYLYSFLYLSLILLPNGLPIESSQRATDAGLQDLSAAAQIWLVQTGCLPSSLLLPLSLLSIPLSAACSRSLFISCTSLDFCLRFCFLLLPVAMQFRVQMLCVLNRFLLL